MLLSQSFQPGLWSLTVFVCLFVWSKWERCLAYVPPYGFYVPLCALFIILLGDPGRCATYSMVGCNIGESVKIWMCARHVSILMSFLNNFLSSGLDGAYTINSPFQMFSAFGIKLISNPNLLASARSSGPLTAASPPQATRKEEILPYIHWIIRILGVFFFFCPASARFLVFIVEKVWATYSENEK